MKDLQLTDIFPRDTTPLTKFSIKLNGSWTFATPVNPVRTGEMEYYKISYPFGVVRETQSDPSKTFMRGMSGDYLVKSPSGELGVVTKQIYELTFPKKIANPKKPSTSSKTLNNKDFLTNVVRQYEQRQSNTTAGGRPPRPNYNFKDPTGGQY